MDPIQIFRGKGISLHPWTLEGDTAPPEPGHGMVYEQLHTSAVSYYTRWVM